MEQLILGTETAIQYAQEKDKVYRRTDRMVNINCNTKQKIITFLSNTIKHSDFN
jgi:hypothetical protein